MRFESHDLETSDRCQNEDRRKLIKKAAVSATVLTGCSFIPDRWVEPIIGQVVLPAHAATSGELVEELSENDVEHNVVETHALVTAPGNNKKFTWLPQTGSYYGENVKFVFEGCGEMTVPDGSKTHGADGDTSNHNQMYYFCGTDFQPGEAEYNGGKASVFSPPNCHANTVTMYYTK